MKGTSELKAFGWCGTGDAVIEPAVGRRNLKASKAVLCFSRGSFPRLVKAFGSAEIMSAPRFDGAVRGKVVDGTALYQSSVGSSAAVMLMEEMIASGVRRILMIGLAGSIDPSVRIGDILIPTWGIREEGTSHHYYPAEHKAAPSDALTTNLKRAMGRNAYHLGGVWTTDGVFRETRSKISKHSEMGALAVEMECSALMCVAKYRKIDFASLLIISDELFDGDWNPAFGSKKVNDATDLACKVARRLFSTRRGA